LAIEDRVDHRRGRGARALRVEPLPKSILSVILIAAANKTVLDHRA
jgi:hypothetical protein